jgi:7-cyano-7-deazaguanine synthase
VRPKAIILLSGGLDSTTVLAIAKNDGFDLYTMSFDYGQRHREELSAAERIAAKYGARHRVVTIDLRAFGGSALTDDIDVPKARTDEEIGTGIPVTYVPARNTIFLSFALAWADILVAEDIFAGVNALDYSGYPDCRPEYIEAYERMANLGIRGAVRIRTPLIRLTKQEIIVRGRELGVDYSQTVTCYDPKGGACGRCDACQLRRRGFQMAGLADPTRYAA